MIQCRNCKKTIEDYPCPHCGEEGKAVFKEGGTGDR